MAEKLAVGDVVKLKSGGPPMTVDMLKTAGRCECVWSVGGETKREVFSAAALAAVTESAPEPEKPMKAPEQKKAPEPEKPIKPGRGPRKRVW